MAQISYGTITITDTTDIESIKNWYLATNASSGVTKSTSGWTDTVQQMTTNKQYLWNYEQILGTNNIEISSTQPVIIGHYGINGQNGADGNSIVSIDEYYKITSSSTATSTNPGSTGWTKNGLVVPTNENRYLWNYQVINYSKTAAEGSYTDARVIGVYGDTGERGLSILKVTTTPTSTSGTVGGFNYTYRMSLSTVKSQSGKSEVLIGDVIEYNSNHYRVGYVDSSYVYLSAATSIKGADGQTYYTWIKYAPNDNPTNAQISDNPTGMTYIGIYTGTTTPAPSTASSYAPWMKYIGTDGGQGLQGVSVTSTRELYWLKTTTNPSQITWNSSTSQPSQTIYSTDRQNSWTSVVPTFVNNAVYYTCIETSLSNSTKTWSTPVINNALTNANQKALDAYNTSTARDTEINAVKAQAKHFWWDSEGAHIAAGSNTTSVDNITQGQPDTYTFNALTAPGFLKLRYKDKTFTELTTGSLTFYRPATDGSNYVQGKVAMRLDTDALTFYKPLAYTADDSALTIAAQLNTNGLILSEGGIKAGTSRTDNFIYLSSANFADTISGHTAGTVSLDNYTATDWRQLIGTKFGVRADGTLYANNAVIGGTITAEKGVIGMDAAAKIIISDNTSNAAIYSGNHSVLTSTVNGFYIGADGISIGSKFKYINESGTLMVDDISATNFDFRSGSIAVGVTIGGMPKKVTDLEDGGEYATSEYVGSSISDVVSGQQYYQYTVNDVTYNVWTEYNEQTGITTYCYYDENEVIQVVPNGEASLDKDENQNLIVVRSGGYDDQFSEVGNQVSNVNDQVENITGRLSNVDTHLDELDDKTDGASKTATSFITSIDSGGIEIHDATDDDVYLNYLLLNSDKVAIYRGLENEDKPTEVMRITDSEFMLGNEDSGHVLMEPERLGFYQGKDNELAYMTSTKMVIERAEMKDSEVTTSMRIGEFVWKVTGTNRISLMYEPE